MKPTDIDFYFVTDSTLTKKTIVDDVKAALEAGVKIIQYREKDKSTRNMLEEASKIKNLCIGKAVFLVNDRIDVALASGADGVHLGQDDMPYEKARQLLGKNRIIGITVHNPQEAVTAEEQGADYLGASPIFETQTKKDAGKQAGLQLLREIRKTSRAPVVAIGGINLENVASVINAGADSAAAISAVIAKDDVAGECGKFIRIISELKRRRTC